MNYYVHITRRAEKDLSQALDYMPERYALVDDKLLSAWGIRYIQIKKYLAFYVISKETQTVHIVRFLYGKSDWRSILHRGFTAES